MGRYIFKLSVFLGLIAGIANYLIYLGTGRVPFNDAWQAVKKTPIEIPSPSTLDLPALPKLPSMSADNSARAFKWTDQNGVVHYSDQAPDGQNAKIISVDPNQNLVQGSPVASSETDAETKTTPAPAQQNAVNLKGPTTIDNASIQQLLQQVKAAAEAAKQRPTE